MASQRAKEKKLERDLNLVNSTKRVNLNSERMNKNRSQEPIEIRLMREGKLIEKRRQAKLDKENQQNNRNKPKKNNRKKRILSSMGQPSEIIMTNKGKRIIIY